METPFPTHQPEPRKDSLGQRYKFIWRFFLISNLALGAYMFAMARKRDMSAENGKTAAKVHSAPVPEEPAPVHEEPAPTPIVELMKEPAPPLHEEQKRELFEWMLEEKRKIKPKDRLEKKRIDEEKFILKQFIRSKSIPDL